mmetsp:Transcript_17730/g.54543  ORF Transcript_17730/g.54543 Transcript_17730/m.54543 type:complete len:395 (+) Transcript_17730:616-1800(+)
MVLRRIAVQIWHQRRRREELKPREDVVRRHEAKSGLKGLKSGFLNSEAGSGDSPPTDKESKVMKWPRVLPSCEAVLDYEALKAACLAEDALLTKDETRQRLRKALMERCQKQVPWMLRLHQERRRLRGALQHAQWQSDATPTTGELRNLEDFEKKCTLESAKVKEEANWLGERDGIPGLGDRIWSEAFEIHAKRNTNKAKHEKARDNNHDRLIKAYAERSVRPWPSELPGLKQRLTYDQMKGTVLKQSSTSAQRAMLHGRSAPQIVGAQVACQLRSALMARCQQIVPLVHRLQAESRAFREAVKMGYVDEDAAVRFEEIDYSVKAEIEAVKIEAEWLSDHTGTKTGMGDQIWPAAFEIYTKRRAEVAEQIKSAQRQLNQIQPRPLNSVVADAVD